MAVCWISVSADANVFPRVSGRPVVLASAPYERDVVSRICTSVPDCRILLCASCNWLGTVEFSRKEEGQPPTGVDRLTDRYLNHTSSCSIHVGVHGRRSVVDETERDEGHEGQILKGVLPKAI